MKKGTKKPFNRLIVDEFQKIKKAQVYPPSKQSYSNEQQALSLKIKAEEVACKYCGRYIPEENLIYHHKVCQIRLEEGENYYDMVYPRPQHHHKQKEEVEREARNYDQGECNNDYYQLSKKQEASQGMKNAANKPKRPQSAMNKKLQIKPKSSLKIEQKQLKLNKVTSSSRIKDQGRNYYQTSKEKGDKGKQNSKYDQTYLKSTVVGKKQPLSLYPNSNTTKLKKKNANMAQRFMNEEKSIEERSVRRPDSRSRKEERSQLKDRMKQEQSQQIERRKHKQQARFDPPQITTQKLKEMVRGKLKEDREAAREVERQRKRDPVQEVRRENNRQQPDPRQPIRTQVRNQRETEHQNHPHQRSSRNPNQNRRQNSQRPRNRPANRNTRFIPNNHPNFFNLIQRTINNQLQMMNHQFAIVSNICQNFSNYVNINIESNPSYYQFTTHEFNSSSEQASFDSDSSSSYSSSYDDYYEEEAEGMDDEQLNCIQNKRYRVEQHGQNQCTICLVELRNGDVIKQLFCDHVFHSECIEEWLRRKSACPVCRDQLGS